MKKIDYSVMDDIEKILKGWEEQKDDAERRGDQEERDICKACIYAAKMIMVMAELKTSEEYVLINKRNFVEYYGKSVEVSDSPTFENGVIATLQGYADASPYPVFTGLGNTYRYARAGKGIEKGKKTEWRK